MQKEEFDLETAMDFANVGNNDDIKSFEQNDNKFIFFTKNPRSGGVENSRIDGDNYTTNEDSISVVYSDNKVLVTDKMTSGWRDYRDNESFGLVVEHTTDYITSKEYSVIDKDKKKYLSCKEFKIISSYGTHDSFGGEKGNSEFKSEFIGEQLAEVSDDYKLTYGLNEIVFSDSKTIR